MAYLRYLAVLETMTVSVHPFNAYQLLIQLLVAQLNPSAKSTQIWLRTAKGQKASRTRNVHTGKGELEDLRPKSLL